MLKYLSKNRRSLTLETQTNSHHDKATDVQRKWRYILPRVKVTYNSDADGANIFYIISQFVLISSWNTIKLEHYIERYYKILQAKVGIIHIRQNYPVVGVLDRVQNCCDAK